jgi:hypothetical protein
MYALLLKLFPPRVADIIMVVWYAVLILLVCRWFILPAAEFRYLNI